KTIDESISQAKAAAARACTIISKDKYEAEATISSVNEDICAGCGVCVSVCPYDAPELITKGGRVVSHVNEALCKGCGSCACACPSGAIEHLGFKVKQTLAMLEAALR
ncbi:MAG: heterodisulfide reductase, partial [bacterium (Candidatus Stahlbacteria) CG23_combo_of_CG06-09_8_20_14_all_40_9]